MSEKITEFLINDLLIENGYIDRSFNSKIKEVKVFSKKSDSIFIKNLLTKASKNKTANAGYPDFIIYDNDLKLIILIECKDSLSNHISNQGLDSFSEISNMEKEIIKKYAVNGSLWYSSFLKNGLDVFSLGISGDKKNELKISTYFWRKNSNFCLNLDEKEFRDIDWYRNKFKEIKSGETSEIDHKELNEEAKKINEFLHGEMGIEEQRRLYVLGSILLALEVPYFQDQYSNYTNNKELSEFLWSTVERKIKNQKIKEKSLVMEELKPVILSLENAQKEKNKLDYPFGTLVKLIKKIDDSLFKIYKNKELDLISFFFNIFLQYTTKGGSSLGIVLTPRHITKLFVKLAGIDINSKVMDICAGTGGFLTATWKEIMLNSSYKNDEKEKFRVDNLYGVENKPTIFTTSVLNMLINSDGKTNLYKKDCFEMKEKIKKFECNFGFLNPPYSDYVYS
ncbi:MAG: N-6 DNA methylase [Candidatus Moeniiplasma glomeromycotorum]|nr:N-6 DNA methylase [Candidatus Moeniiplasma glomeromycotorum]MCE8169172.1 N-6 DNA methylase [Candidatus Moeniiplasma glomeromycotorum]